jgi:regulation of enolase protein 1 (concanavalin A-like superfamily)
LTVTGTGKARSLNPQVGRLTAPRYLREVKGDFTFQVRVAGTFRPAVKTFKGHEVFQAGVLLTDGRKFVKLLRTVYLGQREHRHAVTRALHSRKRRTSWGDYRDIPLARPTSLRLQRRGDRLRVAFSHDGRKWTQGAFPGKILLPRKVQVGVVVEAEVPGAFRVQFDQVKFSPAVKQRTRTDNP